MLLMLLLFRWSTCQCLHHSSANPSLKRVINIYIICLGPSSRTRQLALVKSSQVTATSHFKSVTATVTLLLRVQIQARTTRKHRSTSTHLAHVRPSLSLSLSLSLLWLLCEFVRARGLIIDRDVPPGKPHTCVCTSLLSFARHLCIAAIYTLLKLLHARLSNSLRCRSCAPRHDTLCLWPVGHQADASRVSIEPRRVASSQPCVEGEGVGQAECP